MSSLSPKDRVSLCSFTFSDGRRCRTPRSSSHPHFCFYHAQKEARAFATDKLGKDLAFFFSGDYLSACDLSTALARLILAVVRGEVKPKTAHTVAYLFQTLMQAIHASQHEYCEAFDTDDWRQAIRNSVKGNYNYRFPSAPKPRQPAQPQPVPVAHPVRGEESASSSNSSLATRHSSLPQQPAPSPHTPLPATSAEFVQHVLAGLQTGERQAPQPAQAIPPAPAPQPAETSVNCHSERSRPTLSSAFAPANASACAVEESAFSESQADSQIISVTHPATGEAFRSTGVTSSVPPPTPAQQPASQPAQTAVNSHSEPSEEPAFPPSPVPPQIQAQQNSSAPLAKAPQPAPVAQPFRSWALPPHVRRRLHRDPA